MTVTIDENVILFIAGAIFIPVFVFVVKLTIEIGGTKGRLEVLEDYIKEIKDYERKLRQLEAENAVLKEKVENLRRELDEMRRTGRFHSYYNEGAVGRGPNNSSGGDQ